MLLIDNMVLLVVQVMIQVQELSANWLAVWSGEDLNNMQAHDVDICVILDLKSQFNQKPSKNRLKLDDLGAHGNFFVTNGILYF